MASLSYSFWDGILTSSLRIALPVRPWFGAMPEILQGLFPVPSELIPSPYDENGLVKAAPKKKVTRRSRRIRQLAAPKHVKPVLSLDRCPSCGHIKRAHTLCTHCVKEIQKIWRARDAPKIPRDTYTDSNLDDDDLRVLYPGRRETNYKKDLKRRGEYLWSRPRTFVMEDRPKKERESRYTSAARIGPKPMPMILKKPFANNGGESQ